MTIQKLRAEGEKIASTLEGTVHLWEHNGTEYVVLPDNSVITRDEDEQDDLPCFPRGLY